MWICTYSSPGHFTHSLFAFSPHHEQGLCCASSTFSPIFRTPQTHSSSSLTSAVATFTLIKSKQHHKLKDPSFQLVPYTAIHESTYTYTTSTMSHIVLRENASKRSSWKQLDDLALEYNAKEEIKHRRSMMSRSNKLPTSLATMTNRRTVSCSSVSTVRSQAALAMEELENALTDILDEAEQVISSPTGQQEAQTVQQQEQVVEDASRPQGNERASLYGFETDSTWDDFCNELSVDE